MMSELDKKKMALQLRQVENARWELEIRIEEMLAEVERVKKHIEIQSAKEEELKAKLAEHS